MPHEGYMFQAMSLAVKGAGHTSPNPVVGAVIVRGDKIIGRGWHKKAGMPHAEIEAIKSAKESVSGAALYVTLEPCCHWGRTPPCTDAIISAGIKKVVIGHNDPNPKVAGKGVRALKAAGIDVVTGVLRDECRGLNEAYIKYITSGMPFVTLKLASSLDGRIAAVGGASKWITGIEARRHAHYLRGLSDAVMVGVNTVLADDPELTVRLVKGKNPVRVVLDSALKTPLSAKVFADADKDGLIIFTSEKASRAKATKAKALGAEVVRVSSVKGGVDMKEVMKELGRREITSLLVEGGGTIAAGAVKKGLIDKLCLFMAPKLIGGDGVAVIGPLCVKDPAKALPVSGMTIAMFGKDILVEGYFKGI